MQTLALKHKTKYSKEQNIVVLQRIRDKDVRMVKQRICGVVLALCGAVPAIMEKDITALVFLSFMFLPMLFSKQYIMMFDESKNTPITHKIKEI